MSAEAIEETTKVLRLRLEAIKNKQDEQLKVSIGAPVKPNNGEIDVSLLLFHLEPNSELRNEPRFEAPRTEGPTLRPAMQLDALPLNLRYLITVFRNGSPTADAYELSTLGKIIQTLHAEPTLIVSIRQPNIEQPNLQQIVRVTPEPYPMEELSRIWGLFPNEVYRTSMVYLATPVFIEADLAVASPVLRLTQKTGVLSDTPDQQEQRGGGL